MNLNYYKEAARKRENQAHAVKWLALAVFCVFAFFWLTEGAFLYALRATGVFVSLAMAITAIVIAAAKALDS